MQSSGEGNNNERGNKMNVREMHAEIKELDAIKISKEKEFDEIIEKALSKENLRYDRENDILIVPHYHYDDELRISVYASNNENKCKPWIAGIDGITYMVNAKNADMELIRDVHDCIMGIE